MRKILTFVLSLSVATGFSQSVSNATSQVNVKGGENNIGVLKNSGVNKKELKREVHIYPNPMGITTTVSVSDHETDMRLISITGKVLRNYQLDGSGSIQIERAGLPSGLYFLQVVYTDGSKVTKKLIIK